MSYSALVTRTGRRAALAAMGLLFPILLMAQNYVFGPNVRVNDDSPGVSFHSTYSPGQHLIACRGDTVYLVWRGDQSGTTHAYFSRSNDGGLSFLPSVQVDRTAGVLPSLAVDDSGRIHVSWLNGNSAGGSFTYYSKSTDGGLSFMSPTRACDSLHEDQYAHCSIAVSKSGRNVYVARSEAWNDSYPASPYQIRLSRSTDGGATFLTPDTRVNSDTTVSMYNPSVAAFDDTIVFIAWTGDSLYMARSTDGGSTFGLNVARQDSLGTADLSIGADTVGRVFVVGDGVNFCASTDTGKTFSDWLRIPSANGTDPSLWVSRDGRLYVTWDFWNGADGMWDEVRLSYSTDGGATFSAPVDPSDGPLQSNQDWATVTANQAGTVFMAWMDDRNDPAGPNNDVYFATGALAAVEERPMSMPPSLECHLLSNPSRVTASFAYSVARPGPLSIRILDLAGRTVASLYEGPTQAGSFHLTWNGKDKLGRRVGAGVYFLSLRTSYASLTRKVLLVSD